MIRRTSHATTGLCLIIPLLTGLGASPVRADDSHHGDRAIRLYATAYTGPIGRVESLGPVAINGRVRHGQVSVWGGDLIHACGGGSVRVALDSIGQVTLKECAMATLTSVPARFDDGSPGKVLIVSLVGGSIRINLFADATSTVEAGGLVFTASRGARFGVGLSQRLATVNTQIGSVQAQGQAPSRRYKIAAFGPGLDISVSARSSREVQVRVTDQNDNPVPDVPVVFALSKAVGTLTAGQTAGTTVTVVTGSQGVATASFTAGTTSGSASISAAVPGTSASVAGGVSVSAAAGISAATIGIIAAAVGAGGAGVALSRKGGGNSQAAPPQPQLPPPIRFDPPNVRP